MEEFSLEYYPRLEELFLSKNFDNIRLARVMLSGLKKPKDKRYMLDYIKLLFLSDTDHNADNAYYLYRHLPSKDRYAWELIDFERKVKNVDFSYRGQSYWDKYSSYRVVERINWLLQKYHSKELSYMDKEIPKIFKTIDLTNK